MKDGFIKIACAVPQLKVADCNYNTENILDLITEAYSKGVKVVCFPELCITGYTCSDLFLQSVLLESAKNSIQKIAENTFQLKIFQIFVKLKLLLNK